MPANRSSTIQQVSANQHSPALAATPESITSFWERWFQQANRRALAQRGGGLLVLAGEVVFADGFGGCARGCAAARAPGATPRRDGG
jgi:hypothetical protein